MRACDQQERWIFGIVGVAGIVGRIEWETGAGRSRLALRRVMFCDLGHFALRWGFARLGLLGVEFEGVGPVRRH